MKNSTNALENGLKFHKKLNMCIPFDSGAINTHIHKKIECFWQLYSQKANTRDIQTSIRRRMDKHIKNYGKFIQSSVMKKGKL